VNLYLVRHAHAGDRGRWTGPDHERPLSARGRDQANAITEAFAGVPIDRVLSSPAVRCQQTVAAVASAAGVPLEITEVLAEGAPLAPARALLDELARAGTQAILCGHGDLLPELLHSLERDGTDVQGSGCAKGSVWTIEVDDGKYVRATYERHPGDPDT
jgi:phosphohistidine phosphatase SixA